MIDYIDKVSIIKTFIGGIPTIFIENEVDSAIPKPIIIVFHRLLQDKEYELYINYKLARQGYFVVGIDMYGHGERRINDTSKYDFNNLIKDSYMTASDIAHILCFLKKDMNKRLDFNHIGAIGISNGANIALVAGHLIKEIKYVVSLIGVVNWEYIVQNSLFKFFKHFAVHPEVMDKKKVISDVFRYEPINKYNGNNLIPILFMNGSLDTAIPAKALQDYFDKFTSIFAEHNKQDKLEFMRYPNTGHEVTDDMITDLVRWINKKNNYDGINQKR